MKFIGLDLVRATEKAAVCAAKLAGCGDKYTIDKMATDGMRNRLNELDFAGRIVIGEGIKDNAPGLFNGEYVGKQGLIYSTEYTSAGCPGEYIFAYNKTPKLYDIAVDPVDGTTQTSIGGNEAMSVIALSNSESMYATDHHYMQKLAYGPELAKVGTLGVLNEISVLSEKIRKILDRNFTVCILNRPRHEFAIEEFRKSGARIKLIPDCDVSASIATCRPDSGVDLLFGVGGAPEAVLSAAAMKCLGGEIEAVVVDKNMKIVNGSIFTSNDLIKGPCVFAATGITNGFLLKGVRFGNNGPITHSVFMRSESKTVRWLTVEHGN